MPSSAPVSTSSRGLGDLAGLAVALVVCFAAAGLGSLLTVPQIPGWYASLEKPAWQPPNWLFSPVWTTLFAMMAVAVWLVWRNAPREKLGLPLALFGVQLLLNIAWSALFFALRSPALALLEICLLWLAILATLIAFARVHRGAGLLLVPYLLWVSFAAILNLELWRLNG